MGFAVAEKIRDAIKLVPKKIWTPAADADGGVREGGDVAELNRTGFRSYAFPWTASAGRDDSWAA